MLEGFTADISGLLCDFSAEVTDELMCYGGSVKNDASKKSSSRML